MICACSTDSFIILFVYCGQYLSLWYGHICDCIVFDVWCAVTSLGMFFGVNLGWATTLVVKMGLKMGWCTTFDFFECIRETDTTERFFVFGRKTSVCVSKTNIASWTITMCKALSLDSQKHTIILYYYSIFSYHKGRGLHFRASSRKPGTAYLMFPRLNPHFWVR